MYELKENITGGKAIYSTKVKINLNKDVLCFEFYSNHCSMNSYSSTFNDDLFKADVVELFIEKCNSNHYYEIEVAPNGTLFIGDIFNDGQTRKLTYLENKGIDVVVSREKDILITKISIDLNVFCIPNNAKFNAYRIETDGEKPEKYLFALNPTLCPSFHEPSSFVELIELVPRTTLNA